MSSKAARGLILVNNSNMLETPYEAAVAQLHNDVALAINKFMNSKGMLEAIPVNAGKHDLHEKLNKARSDFLGKVYDILVEVGKKQDRSIGDKT